MVNSLLEWPTNCYAQIICILACHPLLSRILVKRDMTSKETNLYPSLKRLRGMLLIRVTASKLSFVVNLLVVIRFSNLVRYLVIWLVSSSSSVNYWSKKR